MADMEVTSQTIHALYAEFQARHLQTKDATQLLESAASKERRVKLRLDATVTRLARKECLQITDLMYRKLPAELRTSVYECLCIEDRLIPVGPYYHFRHYEFKPRVRINLDTARYVGHVRTLFSELETTPGVDPEVAADIRDADVPERENYSITLPDGRTRYDHTFQSPTDIVLPSSHIFNVDYVGAEVALEAQRFYYANNTFSICNVDDGIHRFFHRFFRVAQYTGFEERSCHERRTWEHHKANPWAFVHDLQIRIKYEHFKDFLKRVLEHQPPTAAESFAYERNFLRDLEESLQPLLEVPLSARTLNIEFIIMTDVDEDDVEETRPFGNLLQAIRHTIYRLIYDRPNISVKVIHHNEHTTSFPRDITQLWSLTKEQWEQEKSANKGLDDWTEEFYVGGVFHKKDGGIGGYPDDQEVRAALMMERWGISNVFADTKARGPIKESWYWPVYRGVEEVDRIET